MWGLNLNFYPNKNPICGIVSHLNPEFHDPTCSYRCMLCSRPLASRSVRPFGLNRTLTVAVNGLIEPTGLPVYPTRFHSVLLPHNSHYPWHPQESVRVPPPDWPPPPPEILLDPWTAITAGLVSTHRDMFANRGLWT